MKQKIVDLWFNHEDIMELVNDPARKTWYSEASLECDVHHNHKLTFVIKYPEKKIEISESRFDEIVKKFERIYDIHHSNKDMVLRLKKEIFGKDEGGK